MKAIVIYQAGGPDQLKLVDLPTPQLRPGWSLVKIHVFGLNHSEVYTRKGQSPTVHFPRILGIEGVGEIAQTTDPQRLPVGQAVISIMGEMGRNFDGSYAEYALLPNQQIYPVTTDLPWSQLAVFPETYYTTYTSLKNLRPAPGDRYLIRGGTSGVGIAMLNLIRAKDPQAYVAGTSRSLAKAARMKDAGYSTVIKDQNGHLQTAEKFDKVLELIGPVTVKETFTHVNEGGIVCVTGILGNQWTLEHFDPITDIAPGTYLTGGYSGAVTEEKINELFSYLQRYQVAAKPDRIFALRDLPAAHAYLASGQSMGKVVIDVDA
ncbi:zinc-binding dehydrogenase [Limosilactobacillus fermentum]|uniref:zinc-binding dehydrogenase n=1 Tax=Limosilactobacillus fermentum TaxID=1613 RepID=UPI000582A4CF|nr:zinc-binding dehydrogenase [Limosilactobacillus fermentum]KPH03815.1 quinone oxidoreductase [Limosilactobacillus fermentum]MCZ2326407.1 zinc-binding dehydrogenase [Limosilactobacillus fermentum]CDI68539.1 Oxidoreductase [Limosilactobacillus fermentum L930BB]